MGSSYPSFTTSSSLLFFQVLRKEASQFPSWGQHFGRGNQPKGESIFTGKNFAIWKCRVRIFPARWDSRFKFSHSVHCGADKNLSPERENLYPAFRQKRGEVYSFSCICCFLIAFSSIVSRASQVALWLKKKKKSACKCRRRKFDSWTEKMP